MYRLLFFLLTFIISTIFGWWLFLLFCIAFVYIARSPYEILLLGFLLDSNYYFGESFFMSHPLFLFSLFLVLVHLSLEKSIHWRKMM